MSCLLLAGLLAAFPNWAFAQFRAPVEIVVPIVSAPIIVVPQLSSLSTLSGLPLAWVQSVPAVLSAVTLAAVQPSLAAPRGQLAESRALRLVITGPPGSGKGTYAKRIAEDFGAVPISAGELLRAYAKDHPDIAAIMQAGKLVPAELVVGLVRARLGAEDVRRRGFILDGFPRRVEEARALEAILRELGTPLDAVVFLEVPERELLRRVLLRGRADDNEQTFRERMRVYHAETEPVFDFLRARAPFLRPSVASGDPVAAYAEVRRVLESLP